MIPDAEGYNYLSTRRGLAKGSETSSAFTTPPTKPKKTGESKKSDEPDKKNHTSRGYNFVFVSVRGQRLRHRVILDVGRAVNSDEMEFVTGAVAQLRSKLGDRFRCIAYDKAMTGVSHVEIRAAGVVSVTKPSGERKHNQWEQHIGEVVGPDAKVFELPIDCIHHHLFTLTAGMIWDLGVGLRERDKRDEVLDRIVRERVVEVELLERLDPIDEAGYSWRQHLIVRCSAGDHRVAIDPNDQSVRAARLSGWLSRGLKRSRLRVNFAHQLRLVQMNGEDYRRIIGRRNDSESGNNSFKNDFGHGGRAGSTTSERVELDIWIYTLLANALMWKELTQARAKAEAAAAAEKRSRLEAQMEADRNADPKQPRRRASSQFHGLQP